MRAAFSAVVRISVMAGVWWWTNQWRKAAGTDAGLPKLTMSSAPGDTTCEKARARRRAKPVRAAGQRAATQKLHHLGRGDVQKTGGQALIDRLFHNGTPGSGGAAANNASGILARTISTPASRAGARIAAAVGVDAMWQGPSAISRAVTTGCSACVAKIRPVCR